MYFRLEAPETLPININRLFDEFFVPTLSSITAPAFDIIENNDATVVMAEVPGVAKEDLAINYDKGMLSLSGIRKEPALPEKSAWLRRETSFGEFDRKVTIAHPVNVDGITADLKNGLLTVTLPKSEEAKPRQIAVR